MSDFFFFLPGAALGALGAHSKPAPPGAPRGNTILRGPEDHIAEQVRMHATWPSARSRMLIRVDCAWI